MKHQTKQTHNSHNETQKRLKLKAIKTCWLEGPRWRCIDKDIDPKHTLILRLRGPIQGNCAWTYDKMIVDLRTVNCYYKPKSKNISKKFVKKITNRRIRKTRIPEGNLINTASKEHAFSGVDVYWL